MASEQTHLTSVFLKKITVSQKCENNRRYENEPRNFPGLSEFYDKQSNQGEPVPEPDPLAFYTGRAGDRGRRGCRHFSGYNVSQLLYDFPADCRDVRHTSGGSEEVSQFAVYERVRAYRAGYPDRLYGVLPCKHPSDVVPCASPEHFVLRPDAVFLYAVSELYPDA